MGIYIEAYKTRLMGAVIEDYPVLSKIIPLEFVQLVTDFIFVYPPSTESLANLGCKFKDYFKESDFARNNNLSNRLDQPGFRWRDIWHQ